MFLNLLYLLSLPGGIQSSGAGSRRCALRLGWTLWQVGRDSGQTCSTLGTSIMSWVTYFSTILPQE